MSLSARTPKLAGLVADYLVKHAGMDKSAADKVAGGITVYLLEELGDARLRCAQLKKYVKEATDLIEKSPQRDHFFEVAAHLIHGIPDALFKLEKALDASALAAARLDYEEIKENLKPEKADELEDVLQDVRLRYLKRRSDATTPKTANKAIPISSTLQDAYLAGIASPDADATATAQHEAARLVDAAHKLEHMSSEAKKLTAHSPLKTPIGLFMQIANSSYDLAFAVGQAQGAIATKTAQQKVTNMTPKQAAEMLTLIADETEKTGKVPLSKVMVLLARVEGRNKRASTPAAKAAAAFRKAATDVTSSSAPTPAAMASWLRNVLADQMTPTSAQVAAMVYQQANSREEVMKGFKEHNPAMSEEDLEKAADHWEKNKDNFKA